MRIIADPSPADWPLLTKRPASDLSNIRETVKPVLDEVRRRGDVAVREFTARFDGVEITSLEVDAGLVSAASDKLHENLKSAIRMARNNIARFHELQREKVIRTETMAGITCWRKSLPIDSVGLYIPGGTAPLFSTVLMLAVPAAIAGCGEVVLCSPPGKDGSIHPAILFTAGLCGVHRIFRVGGAQAIAAMAYGTSSIPRVDKIFGPGNQYVTSAKQLIQQDGIAIDLPAGPSEVAVIADDSSCASHVAADLIAQAEHGADSQVLLLTDSHALAEHVRSEVTRQLEGLPRRNMAETAIGSSLALVFKDLASAMDFSNLYAPEHLIINTRDHAALAEKVRNAGSVFLGPWTPETLGDYASGTNHTLPTNGYARSYSGVSLDSFVKKITFQEATRSGLENMAATLSILAENELLEGHRKAVTVRLKDE